MIKIRKLKKLKIVFLINLIILLSAFYISNLDTNRMNEYEDSFQDYSIENNLKKAGFWTLTPLVIDDDLGGDYTWLEASSEDWCTGSGTYSDPYIIENIIINGQNSSSCLTIQDSLKYFIIRNCTFYNAGLSPNAGLKIDDVQNGYIYKNNVSFNNRWGIYLTNGSNCTVANNAANYNVGNNIFVSNSDHNVIINNIANDGKYMGIKLENSDWIVVQNNTANRNDQAGISISWRSHNNTITENIVMDNDEYGIMLDNNCTQNNLTNNYAESNKYGIGLWQGCNETVITGNTMKNNTQYGLSIYYFAGVYSDNNLIYSNFFFDNVNQAQDFGSNNQWNNSLIGNYWSDYVGVDANDDGIGDTPYNIQGPAGSQDNYPLMWTSIVIIINSPQMGDLFDVSPNFNISIEIGIANTTWYTLDGGLTNFTFTGLTGKIDETEWDQRLDGLVTIKFFANNSGGDISSNKVTVIKETIKVTINAPTLNKVFGLNSPEFIITIDTLSPINTTWYTIDGGLTNYTFSGFNDFINQTAWDQKEDGVTTIKFYANDTLGNLGFSILNVIKDTALPVITLISPNDNELFGASAPSFNVEIYDANLDTLWYSLNGGVNITFTLNGTINQTEWTVFSDGTMTIIFYANDTAGNIIYKSVNVIKDTTISFPLINIIIIATIIVSAGVIVISSLVIIKPRMKKKLIENKKRKLKERQKLEKIKAEREKEEFERLKKEGKEEISTIKKTTLNLSTKYTRLSISEISEFCGISDESLINNVIQDMIENKEVHAHYFASTKSIAFDQQVNIAEIDELMEHYKQWENEGRSKK